MPARKTKKPADVRKTFVLDTNVLLHSAACLDAFKEHHVVLPMAVLEELDTFKGQSSELGRNARAAIRRLDALRSRGSLATGVPLRQGGTIRVLLSPDVADSGLDSPKPDNRIIGLAYTLSKAGEPVVFISKDINARVKADALAIRAEDFECEKVKVDELFTGHAERTAPATLIARLQRESGPVAAGIKGFPNLFLTLTARNKPDVALLTRMDAQGRLTRLDYPAEATFGIRPRNPEQQMALSLLLDPSVSIVTLVGQAGTGKTLLALAAALDQVLHAHTYDRLLVSRPIVPLGKDIGYLPGSKDEKLTNWMEPIFDNLAYLVRANGAAFPMPANRKAGKITAQDRIQALLDDDIMELEALTYIRGRSISRQFIIIDEAQNLTPHEVKTVISRAGEKSKIVLTGDPDQIDNPYLDLASNGLSYAVERLKPLAFHGHVTLRTSERSALAAAAAAYL